MRRRSPFLLLVAVATLVALTVPATAQAPTALEAEVVPFEPDEIRVERYPMTDLGNGPGEGDDRTGTATWRVALGTGNCCEVYPYTTPDGTIYDFGGTYIHFTEDDGETWYRVRPDTPLINGEGTIAYAPNGDILGVGWDPYTGDHLQAYKYDASDDAWYYHEMPLHTPFYDREWIAVIPGPFTVDGEEVPYITFVKGGWPSKEMYLWSSDGLVYRRVSSKTVDKTFSGDKVSEPLPIAADLSFDWIQPISETGIVPLGDGAAFASPDFPQLSRDHSLYDPVSMTWTGYTFPDGSNPEGRFQVDSRGRLHNVVVDGTDRGFTYRISTDGGATFSEERVATPGGEAIEEIDFHANGALGLGVVAVRAEKADGNDQDLVFKLDVSDDTARLTREYEVGLGDIGATSGVGNSVRFDFEAVAILPDGRAAVSFHDSTTGNDPAVAIELGDSFGDAPGASRGRPLQRGLVAV